MGTCYSKSAQGASADSSPEKSPLPRPPRPIKKRFSLRSSKRRSAGSDPHTAEAEPLQPVHDFSNGGLNGTSRNSRVESLLADSSPSRSLTPDISSLHHQDVKKEGSDRVYGFRKEGENLEGFVQPSVVPSDSGIESIGTAHEDTQQHQKRTSSSISAENVVVEATVNTDRSDGVRTTVSKACSPIRAISCDNGTDGSHLGGSCCERRKGEVDGHQLSNRLERLSRGSCHRCGNFRLDDTALSALLVDTYCLCGPRRAGQPSVNPQCQTHGLARQRSQISTPSSCASPSRSDPDSQTSHWEVTERGVFTSTSTGDPQDGPQPLKSSLKQATSSETLKKVRVSLGSEGGSNVPFSSKSDLDDVFESDEVVVRMLSKQSLSQKEAKSSTLDDFILPPKHKRRSLLSEILDITDSICRCDFYSNEVYCMPVHEQEVEPISQSVQCVRSSSKSPKPLSPSHQYPSSPTEVLSYSSPSLYSPRRRNQPAVQRLLQNGHTPVQAKLSTTSSQSLSIEDRESLLSLGSSDDILLSGSSTCGEDDDDDRSSHTARGTSQDGFSDTEVESVGRMTSLSYSSVQQLLESTEELSEPMSQARRMVIDGVDSVIIPTETYKQMEADLKILKDQLQALSSLMLEEDSYTLSEADGSYLENT